MGNWYDRPEPSAELSKLEPFAGEWTSVDRHEAMPWMKEGGAGHTRNRFRRALDGFCYLTDIEADTPFGKIKGHGLIFFDTELDKFRIEWYDNFGNHMSGDGDYDESRQSLVLVEHYRMGGVDVVERHTSKLIDADHYRHIVETLVDGEFRLTSTLEYERARK